ncbi:MAG: hypothetical protein AAF989_01090 [Planctomycetota bacterium]
MAVLSPIAKAQTTGRLRRNPWVEAPRQTGTAAKTGAAVRSAVDTRNNVGLHLGTPNRAPDRLPIVGQPHPNDRLPDRERLGHETDGKLGPKPIRLPRTQRTPDTKVWDATSRLFAPETPSPTQLFPAQQVLGPSPARSPFSFYAVSESLQSRGAGGTASPNTLDSAQPTRGVSAARPVAGNSHADVPPVCYQDFSPTPIPQDSVWHDAQREAWVYDAKSSVPTQHPWIEWGRIFYGNGITPRGKNWFGPMNPGRPAFYLYGDYRMGIGMGRNAGGRADNFATRLNLDMDLKLTDTERFHAFMGPLDRGGAFNRIELVDGDLNYESVFDPNLVTGYFEGDVGAMLGGVQNTRSPFELPVTFGLVPLLFQNGIWMEDAVTGAAFSIPAKHSRLLNWSNFDWTFFAVVDQLNSAAFGADKHAAQAFGTANFIDAYGGYIESGYAFLYDRQFGRRSYHNMTVSFTRRYFDRISNSIRLIINAGQDLPAASRTADGGLLLVENSLITANPLTVVPYANFFYGWDRPQSVARAGGSGGILRNTGINFDTDGLNGLATLDPTASDTAGGSIGVDLIGRDLDRQWLVEFSYLTPHGNRNANVPDDQFGAGTRYQFPVSHNTLMRFDFVYGWRRGLEDVYGTRMEYRYKF